MNELRLQAVHARYHDQDGNLFGRDDCGEVRCDFWDAAEHTLQDPAVSAATDAIDNVLILLDNWATDHPEGTALRKAVLRVINTTFETAEYNAYYQGDDEDDD